MAQLTTKQLVEITPLDPNVKQQALLKLSQMTEAEKMRLEQICWETIRNIMYVRMNAKLQEEMERVAKDGTEDKIDADAIEDQVIAEFLKTLDAVSTAEEMQQVTQQLKQSMKKNGQ